MNSEFKDYFLNVTGSSACHEVEVIQSLWSGYGKIARYQLTDSSYNTVVVKYISLSQTSGHPRGWNTDYAHNRKVKSYEVETHWYEHWNKQCSGRIRTPKFLGSFTYGAKKWIILEDLNTEFPIRKQELKLSEVKVCLKWLANFHVTFLSQSPTNLWETGTYWHLKTRPDEFEKIQYRELKEKAHRIDEVLNQCKYQTVVHGDAKLANFCFSKSGENVAAVDFQYAGGGCGMKDVAYFLGSCLSGSECEVYENELLEYYFAELKSVLDSSKRSLDFMDLQKEWREMYPVACADFTRFLLGWMPSHQKVNDYNLNMLHSVLASL